jgi:hypothetical protein
MWMRRNSWGRKNCWWCHCGCPGMPLQNLVELRVLCLRNMLWSRQMRPKGVLQPCDLWVHLYTNLLRGWSNFQLQCLRMYPKRWLQFDLQPYFQSTPLERRNMSMRMHSEQKSLKRRTRIVNPWLELSKMQMVMRYGSLRTRIIWRIRIVDSWLECRIPIMGLFWKIVWC